jgi:hypothetical protein
MTIRKFVSTSSYSAVLSLLVFCSLFLPKAITAQTPADVERTIRQMATLNDAAVIMVEIQCKPGSAEAWREAFVKEILPSIREAIRKGDVFTNFTYFEAPLPAQDFDFVLLFELKSFSSLDTRRIPPHYEVLFQRLGPERGEAFLKEMGGWEEKVTVRILRANKR